MASVVNVFPAGQEIRISGSFADASGDPADPTAVFCVVKAPGSDPDVYEYSVDPEVVKDSIGEYYLDQTLSSSGLWVARWYSTGSLVSSSTDVLIRARETLADG